MLDLKEILMLHLIKDNIMQVCKKTLSGRIKRKIMTEYIPCFFRCLGAAFPSDFLFFGGWAVLHVASSRVSSSASFEVKSARQNIILECVYDQSVLNWCVGRKHDRITPVLKR